MVEVVARGGVLGRAETRRSREVGVVIFGQRGHGRLAELAEVGYLTGRFVGGLPRKKPTSLAITALGFVGRLSTRLSGFLQGRGQGWSGAAELDRIGVRSRVRRRLSRLLSRLPGGPSNRLEWRRVRYCLNHLKRLWYAYRPAG